MKKLFLFLLAGIFTAGSYADTEILFTVNGSDGSKKTYNIAEIDNITFSEDNKMTVRYVGGEDVLDMDMIEDMVFGTVSGVDDVFDGNLGDNLHINVERGVVTASQPGSNLDLRIFDMKGCLIDSLSGESSLKYDLSRLNEGAYIVVVNGKAIKFIR